MNVSRQFELVVDHCIAAAVRLQSQVFGIFGQRQRHSLFELACVHRMRKPHRRHQLLQVGIARILVKLILGDRRYKRLAPEIESVVLQNQTSREKTLPHKQNFERLIHWPIVLSTCCNGAADRLKSTVSALLEEIPVSPYSVRPGALTVYLA
jgi:hypothetical protein